MHSYVGVVPMNSLCFLFWAFKKWDKNGHLSLLCGFRGQGSLSVERMKRASFFRFLDYERLRSDISMVLQQETLIRNSDADRLGLFDSVRRSLKTLPFALVSLPFVTGCRVRLHRIPFKRILTVFLKRFSTLPSCSYFKDVYFLFDIKYVFCVLFLCKLYLLCFIFPLESKFWSLVKYSYYKRFLIKTRVKPVLISACDKKLKLYLYV